MSLPKEFKQVFLSNLTAANAAAASAETARVAAAAAEATKLQAAADAYAVAHSAG